MSAVRTETVESFRNFLSWKEKPNGDGWGYFRWPPAVFAYVAGVTLYCPPKGTM